MAGKQEEMRVIQIAGLAQEIEEILLQLEQLKISDASLFMLLIALQKIDSEIKSNIVNIQFNNVIKGFDKPSKERD